MVLISNCDTLDGWTASQGTIYIDPDKAEGVACVRFEGSPDLWEGLAIYTSPTTINLLDNDVLKFWIKVGELYDWVSRVKIIDEINNFKQWNLKDLIPAFGIYYKLDVDLNTTPDAESATSPDMNAIKNIIFSYRYIPSHTQEQKSMRIDYVEAEPYSPPVQHNLNVETTPIIGVNFNINGVDQVTPWIGLLDEGAYSIVMPIEAYAGSDHYLFKQWDDGSTNPTRNIPLVSDRSIVATYEFVLPPPSTKSALFTEGRYIKRKITNKPIVLRGVNKTGYLDEPWGWWTTYNLRDFTQWQNDVNQHLNAMKSWGVNCIRFSITARWWIENTEAYREMLKNAIKMAWSRGIYAVIATWNTEPVGPQVGDPLSDPIFPTQQDFVNYIVSIADYFKDDPNVLIELWNEPVGNETIWMNVAQECVNQVRQVTDHIIIVHYGYSGSLDWILRSQLVGTNIVYSGHIYRFHGTFDGNMRAQSDYQYIYDKLFELGYQQVIETLNLPLLVGEIGANVWWSIDDPAEYIKEKEYFLNTLEILNQLDIGYIVWEWFPSGRAWSTYDNYGTFNPNEVGQILINAIAEAPTQPEPAIPLWLIAIPILGLILLKMRKK